MSPHNLSTLASQKSLADMFFSKEISDLILAAIVNGFGAKFLLLIMCANGFSHERKFAFNLRSLEKSVLRDLEVVDVSERDFCVIV